MEEEKGKLEDGTLHRGARGRGSSKLWHFLLTFAKMKPTFAQHPGIEVQEEADLPQKTLKSNFTGVDLRPKWL